MSEDKKIKELVEAARRKKEEEPEEMDAARPIEDTGSRALAESLKSSFLIIKIIVVVLIFFFIRTLIFTVPSQETAVILRFGKPVSRGGSIFLEPGAHWRFPYPIDEVETIPKDAIQTIDSSVGWYMTYAVWEATQQAPPARPSLDPSSESYTLTSDTNIIHVHATLKYRIEDPLKYAFQFANATNIVQNALDSALYHASAKYNVDDALRLDKRGFQEAVMNHVRELVDEYELGIALEPGSVETIPPRYLKDVFNQAQITAQESDSKIQDARGYAQQVVLAARGQTNAIVNAAQAESLRLVESVKAESEYFQGLLDEYRKDPEFFRERMLVGALQRSMTNVTDKFVQIDRVDGRPRSFWPLLSREPPKPSGGENQ